MASNAWGKAKAEQMIRSQVEQARQSPYPSANLGEGMIQLAYALDLLTDETFAYWQHTLATAVEQRRQELRANRNHTLLKQEVARA